MASNATAISYLASLPCRWDTVVRELIFGLLVCVSCVAQVAPHSFESPAPDLAHRAEHGDLLIPPLLAHSLSSPKKPV